MTDVDSLAAYADEILIAAKLRTITKRQIAREQGREVFLIGNLYRDGSVKNLANCHQGVVPLAPPTNQRHPFFRQSELPGLTDVLTPVQQLVNAR